MTEPLASKRSVRLVVHRHGALRLRWWPGQLEQLQGLLTRNCSWAQGRHKRQLRAMLANSQVIVSLWDAGRLVGFGRATSDRTYRAVLWDVVVAEEAQNQGLGSMLVEALVQSAALRHVERVYLMTTLGVGFYNKLNFQVVDHQYLMLLHQKQPHSMDSKSG